ncbi:MAG: hypothetical protein BWX88_00336 [Planctomycetes bacterium ADurb.Bin126]|nr:MAG: hypothetical protein BWX88_00336 [Planctomycetes bacterium ADurb.Bin126]
MAEGFGIPIAQAGAKAKTMSEREHGNLRTDQLARLLSIGQERELPAEADWADAVVADLLAARLAGPAWLLNDSLQAGDLMGRAGAESMRADGRSLRDALLDPATDLAELTRIKSAAKRSADRSKDDRSRRPEHLVALAVYYGAIAAAMVHRGRKITAYTPAQLGGWTARLAGKRWMAPDLAGLLRRAGTICRRNSGDNHDAPPTRE